jgi:hypothetical protein
MATINTAGKTPPPKDPKTTDGGKGVLLIRMQKVQESVVVPISY